MAADDRRVDPIHPTTPAQTAYAVGERRGTGNAAPSARQGRPAVRRAGHGAVVDVFRVLGLPAHMITPQVEEALHGLSEQFEGLRHELERLEGREAFLENEAEHDLVAGVHNRRGFLRELSRLIAHLERTGLPGSVVVLHAQGLEALRQHHGLAAADAALAHIGANLTAALRQSDVVGHIDGAAFAVVLTLAASEPAHDKAEKLALSLNSPPFLWHGNSVMFAVSAGVADLAPGMSAEQALAAADAARLNGAPPA